ncbi:MAG: response regulator transcription factor [Acidobacteria bacterium]|nr:response regulator transcription factor [Acidobacteriota bacterium]
MKCLLIEDDKRTADFIVQGLNQEGYCTDWIDNGLEGLDLLMSKKFDVAIVDIMLPGMDGIELIENVRHRRVQTPVLFLSARGTVDDRVKGLNAGGDDYMVKPFAFSELLARIEALLRRGKTVGNDTSLQVGCLVLDRMRHKVIRDGKEIFLQPREIALLEYLMRNAGRVVSKTMIMEHVWDYNFDPQTNVVESRVCRLRDKIDRGFDKKLIHTIRGAGYVLEDKS